MRVMDREDVRQTTVEPGWEVVDERPFEEWKLTILAATADGCPECGGPLTPDNETDDDNWADIDPDGRACEGEVIRRYCVYAYELAWLELHRGHPITDGELLYERVTRRRTRSC